MITSVDIKHLRGINDGRLEGLTPLTVLVGPNGSGKSTVLEALYLGAHSNPVAAVETVIVLRGGVPDGTRWLVAGCSKAAEVCVAVTTTAGAGTPRRYRYYDAGGAGGGLRCVLGAEEPMERGVFITCDDGGRWSADRPVEDHVPGISEVSLVDLGDKKQATYLPDVFSSRHPLTGRDPAEFLRSVLPELKTVEILTHSGRPVLHLTQTGHVPAPLSGDGIHALTRIVYEVAAPAGSVVLLEEPEVHQHPAAFRASARAIVAAVREGVQVVLTTHSLELVEALLAEARDVLGDISVYGLVLRDSRLISARFPGEEARFALVQIGEDLR
ncbi:MAG: AAA family ATPase [Armatimonadetes bacterium]|nr:AAA family ATPase [Armatimonadota bacterium]